jgi:hypothetical protein
MKLISYLIVFIFSFTLMEKEFMEKRYLRIAFHYKCVFKKDPLKKMKNLDAYN